MIIIIMMKIVVIMMIEFLGQISFPTNLYGNSDIVTTPSAEVR